MCLSSRLESKPRNILRVGMLLLAVALIAQRFVRPAPGLSEDVVDFVRGILFGLSIGLNLWAVRLGSRNGWGGHAS